MATNTTRPLELDLLSGKLEADYAAHIIGTGSDETAKRRNFLSKAVAAFVLREAAGASIKDAVAASIDGGADHGIDSVFIAIDRTIWLVQSKYIDSGKGEPELGDVSKFCDGVRDLLRGKMERFNNKLQQRQIALEDALGDDSCKIEVVLAHTGGAINDDRRQMFGDLERSFNGTNPGFVRCRAFGLTTLHDLHLDGTSAKPIAEEDVELRDFGYINDPYRAFYGRMNVKRLAELWNDHQEQLVDRNIRHFKGKTTVNAGLIETLKKETKHFFYFNNGVTFLCQAINEIHPRDDNRQVGKFRVCGMSIVNGAQTVGAIAQESAEYYDKHPAEILATFICLDKTPEDFGDRVTQSRNRQNAVDLEDFAALDGRQDNWQNTLRMANITYLVKQGEDDPPLSDRCFSAREAAPYLACTITTNWPDYVVAAKTDKKKLFGREGFVSTKDPLHQAYDTLFSDSLTAKRMWRIVQVGRAVIDAVKGRFNEPDPVNQPSGTLPAKEILRNGGWLILHVAFIRKKSLLDDTELFLTENEKQVISHEVDLLASNLVTVVQANKNWGKQARALFENKTDCQTIKNNLIAALAKQNQG